MKKTIILFFMLAAGISLSAQEITEKKAADQKPAKPGMENMLDELKTELKLSEQQSAQLEMIKLKYEPVIKEIRENTSLSRDKKREQSKEVFDKIDKEIEEMLTAEQKGLWKEYKEKRMQNRPRDARGERGRGQGRRGGGGFGR